MCHMDLPDSADSRTEATEALTRRARAEATYERLFGPRDRAAQGQSYSAAFHVWLMRM